MPPDTISMLLGVWLLNIYICAQYTYLQNDRALFLEDTLNGIYKSLSVVSTMNTTQLK